MLRNTLFLLPLFLPLAICDAAEVVLEQNGDTVEVTIDGEAFTTLHHGSEWKKPFFHPVLEKVNGGDHWLERDRIRTKNVEILDRKGDPARLRLTNHWLSSKGEPVLKETTEIAIHGDRMIAYDIRLEPVGDDPVTFADTKEGFFAFRVANELREDRGSGSITNAEGKTGESAVWGKTSPWVDYAGTVDGEHAGVAIFDHPKNFRPARYHARGYGLFAASPFGEKAYTKGKSEAEPVTLQPGEALRLRYALYPHSGDASTANVAERYAAYAKAE